MGTKISIALIGKDFRTSILFFSIEIDTPVVLNIVISIVIIYEYKIFVSEGSSFSAVANTLICCVASSLAIAIKATSRTAMMGNIIVLRKYTEVE